MCVFLWDMYHQADSEDGEVFIVFHGRIAVFPISVCSVIYNLTNEVLQAAKL